MTDAPHTDVEARRGAGPEADEGLKKLIRATTAWILSLLLAVLAFAFYVSTR
jgi:hypothetical protein